MTTPYDAPKAIPQLDSGLKDFPRFRKLAVAGSILLAGPLFGALGTVIAMVKAFSTLAEGDGSADPSVLAGDISVALLSILYGSGVGLVGVLLVSIALFSGKNREKWFYRWSILLAIFWCVLLFPFGVVIGIYLIIAFVSRKQEFAPALKRRQR